jgi:predicted ATP-grasp superfamily ATP-dependent carboligase
LAVVEVKRDARDNKFKLIEINTRPVLYQRLFGKAGLNITETLNNDSLEQLAGKAVCGRPGIYWMHNVSEIYALKRHLLSRDRTLREFFRPYLKPHIMALPVYGDWRPLMASLKKFIVNRR